MEPELREYCEGRRWTLAHEYVDVGISGSKERWPELEADAHPQRFDAVTVWKFDASPAACLTCSARSKPSRPSVFTL